MPSEAEPKWEWEDQHGMHYLGPAELGGKEASLFVYSRNSLNPWLYVRQGHGDENNVGWRDAGGSTPRRTDNYYPSGSMRSTPKVDLERVMRIALARAKVRGPYGA